MTQYNMHSQLNEFYNEHVRLKGERDTLKELKLTNLKRLTDGLSELEKPNFIKDLLQGSIAMHTANKSENNDYDIDIAVIFEKDDLPASALNARKRVAEALNKKASGFTKDPEARTNAVTVWYSDGYHVDIAVYRRSKDWLGNEILEHAGADWAERDPKAITDWFTQAVKDKSPKATVWSKPKVEIRQMRRIVRWIKAFTKAREGWNLPGGLVISVLVAECYKPDNDRDDIALYNTLVAIKNRLDIYPTVYNPTDSSKDLTEKQKFLTQVKSLKKRLGSVKNKLEPLFKGDCTYAKARKAWNYLFQHSYWSNEVLVAEALSKNLSIFFVNLNMGIANTKEGRLKAASVASGRFLPKGVHLKFTAVTNVPYPYDINWKVENSGDEAEEAQELSHERTTGQLINWEHTAYRGKHKMICEIVRDGTVVAESEMRVNIR